MAKNPLSTIVCGRPGCSRKIPVRAERDGDPYCSTDCCRVDHGLDPSKERQFSEDEKARRVQGKKCSGCDVPTASDEYTEGCKTCARRRKLRMDAGTAV